MKKIILLMTVILAGFTGCYKNIPLENPVVPAGLKIVPLDESGLSQEEGDIIVTAHVKKGSYVLSPRTDEDRYTFVFMINDKELIESVKGIEEMESDMHEEKGEGIHHIGFDVKDMDEKIKLSKELGIDILQTGRTPAGGFAYLNTEKIGGVIFELIQRKCRRA